MHAARPDIRNHCRQVLGELILHVQVPLHDIIALRMGINKSGAQPVPGDQTWVYQGESERSSRRTCCRRGRRRFYGGVLKKGYGLSLHQNELVRERQNVEQAGAAADSHFPIVERIPSEADARFKIMQSGVRKQSASAGAASRNHYAADGQRVSEVP